MNIKLREGVHMASGLAVALLCVPLCLILAALSRFALLIALAAMATAAIAYLASPAFRRWLDLEEEPEIRYGGLRLATDVVAHPRHAWARVAGDEATVGADDLVGAVLGPVEAVDLPPPGTDVRQGEPLFRLRHGERTVAVQSPLSGYVARINSALWESPGLVNDAPFGVGWAVRLEASAWPRERRALLRGASARSWFRDEVDRLLDTLQPPDAVPARADGGVLVHELYRHIDAAAWRRVTAEFFGADSDLAPA